ncbi:hypothetical protein HanRHA438_Chr03g0126831 [Helianthus annuus]|uniref:Uncharacterized protein n=1 Tax=Helianthus annuus TaxID=4232 RepID=A0A9K3JGJ7_HELAN|nr:hypothetical protein HanXRQr2_Chr03g0114881 [Helianthus annuus]KAJ0593339.1 hypothetical protein HanHA300_Chr03g0095901 [Helianthus annuus]KAJ0601205.1 hypothetical protein HanIR_Chr03g0125731 [Helianthus annuus]KAJ0608350.1 hypothetical protein HanHA89_Chr03g0107591 [Helianthus annuus]KAJ0768414.1 hypothetical protein HanLR1_Chr03g0100961 [Helianthus annuus]
MSRIFIIYAIVIKIKTNIKKLVINKPTFVNFRKILKTIKNQLSELLFLMMNDNCFADK